MFRWILRWLTRIVITVVVLAVIIHVANWAEHRVSSGSVLVLTLTGPVVERDDNGVRQLVSTQDETPLNIARDALDRGARDPQIAGLAIKVIDPQMEFAQAQELADLIRSFARHHKWTKAYIETAGEFDSGNLPYLVAAAANEVSLMPQGEVAMVGVGMREVFARGLFDKAGVVPNFAAIGKYKDAANIFTEKDFTPAQREEDQALVGDLYGQLVSAIASERNLDAGVVRAAIDKAPLAAPDAKTAHLVDRLEYEDQFDDRIKHYGGGKHSLVDYDDYQQVSLIPHFGHGDRIAVIYGDGAIERGQGGFDPVLSPGGSAMGSDDIVDALNQARDDDSVRAVVFRINSPGGSVIGSELIRRAAELLAKKKPLVVSMSGYAASGGYWISMPAQKIIAEPGTITGSIGVLGGKFNVAPGARNIGVTSGAIAMGANASMFDSFSDFTPAQQQMFQNQILGDTYSYFVHLVSQGRALSTERVDQIAQGRVWSGEQAVQLKLVDRGGGLDTAIEEARKLASIEPEQTLGTLELPSPPGILTQLMQSRLGVESDAGTPLMRAIGHSAWFALSGGLIRATYCPLQPTM